MTNRRENILSTALELFANEGFHAVSTSKIAKQAGVSEGLIFRHFSNKKGLLAAIMEDAEIRMKQLFAPILFENDPQAVIDHIIQMPFEMDQSEYDFWKLQYKLKWESEYNNPNKMKAVMDKLTWAFQELGYEQPTEEARILTLLLDSVAISMMRKEITDTAPLKALLLHKYKS